MVTTSVRIAPASRCVCDLPFWWELTRFCVFDYDGELPSRVAETRARDRLEPKILEDLVRIVYSATDSSALLNLMCNDHFVDKAAEIVADGRYLKACEPSLHQVDERFAEKFSAQLDLAVIHYLIEPVALALGEAKMANLDGGLFERIEKGIQSECGCDGL